MYVEKTSEKRPLYYNKPRKLHQQTEIVEITRKGTKSGQSFSPAHHSYNSYSYLGEDQDQVR